MRTRRFIFGAIAAPLLSAAAAAQTVNGSHHGQDVRPVPTGLVEQVRQVTAQFVDIQAALDAGYRPFLGCVSGPQEGVMGLHLVKSSLVEDFGRLAIDE